MIAAAVILTLAQAAELSLERERFIGQTILRSLHSHSEPIDDPVVSAYVKSLVQRLLTGLDGPARFDYSADIAVMQPAEPLAIPGGWIVIPARFFLTAEDEAEFAAMVAHAIAHLELRQGLGAPRPGSIPYRSSSEGLHIDSTAPRRAAQPLFGPHGQWEFEADRLTVRTLSRAGFPAASFRNYLARVQVESERLILPHRALRLQKLDSELSGIALSSLPADEAFREARDRIRSLLPDRRSKAPPSLIPH